MKRIANKLITDEKGQAFVLVLILLLVGALITAPALGFMSTGLMAGQVYEEKMDELYAADAGVEDGLWHLMYGGLIVPEGGQSDLPPFTMNNETVNVNILSLPGVDPPTYRITSVAGSTIIAHVANITLHFTEDLGLDHGDTIGGNVIVDGDAILNADAVIEGNVIAEGDVILNADAVITGDVCAGGNVTLNARTVIEGSVYAVGNVELHNLAVIQGGVHAGGNVLVDGPQAEIIGDVHISPGATVSGSGSTGDIYYDYVEGCPLDLGDPEILSWEIS